MSIHQGVGISNAMTKEEPISLIKQDSEEDSFRKISLQAIEIVPTTPTYVSSGKQSTTLIRTTLDSSLVDSSTPKI